MQHGLVVVAFEQQRMNTAQSAHDAVAAIAGIRQQPRAAIAIGTNCNGSDASCGTAYGSIASGPSSIRTPAQIACNSTPVSSSPDDRAVPREQ